MSNGRNTRGRRKVDPGRDGGAFIALPWAVVDSSAFEGLSHPARSLLIELARQYKPGNNGRLLASKAHLEKRGWRSADVITRAKRELLNAGFLHETVKGRRPNKASWYALTWYGLDSIRGYDEGAAQSFRRGAYRKVEIRVEASSPPAGLNEVAIAPSHGKSASQPVPRDGTVFRLGAGAPVPQDGHLSRVSHL